MSDVTTMRAKVLEYATMAAQIIYPSWEHPAIRPKMESEIEEMVGLADVYAAASRQQAVQEICEWLRSFIGEHRDSPAYFASAIAKRFTPTEGTPDA